MANLFRANKKGSGGGGIEVDHITITTQPTKTVYAQYDTPDLTGAQITATFADGVTADVTNAVVVSPVILSDTGTQTITLTYGGSTAAFNVTVNAMTAISVTTLPTKTSYQPNEALDLTGIVVTGTAGSLTSNITSGCSFNPADGTILDEEKTYTVNVSYHGLTTSFNVTCSSLPASLEDATWAQIQAAAQNGTLSQFASVGDTKSITFGGYTYHMQLASINTGSGQAGTYYPANTADFISVELLPDGHCINTQSTNAGGWNNCEMRTYLNSTIYNSLPSDLKNIIIEKTHLRTQGNQSSTMVSASDKLWLPSYYEVLRGDGSISESAFDNIRYSIFTSSDNRIKKKVNGSTSEDWWISSPYQSNSTAFYEVSSNSFGAFGGTHNLLGVVIGLRIG